MMLTLMNGGLCKAPLRKQRVLITVTGTGTAKVSLAGTAGATVAIVWPDGATTAVTLSATRTTYEHAVTGADGYATIAGQLGEITDLDATGTGVTQTTLLSSLTACGKLAYLKTHVAQGNLASLQMLPITYFYNTGTAPNLIGDIASLSRGATMQYCALLNCGNISGDIHAFAGNDVMTRLQLNATGIYGDIAPLLGAPLTSISLRLCGTLTCSAIGPVPVLSPSVAMLLYDSSMTHASLSNLLTLLDGSATAWSSSTPPSMDISGMGLSYDGLTADGKAAYDSLIVKNWVFTWSR